MLHVYVNFSLFATAICQGFSCIVVFSALRFLCCAIMLLCNVTLYALGWLAACVESLFQAENVYECISFT